MLEHNNIRCCNPGGAGDGAGADTRLLIVSSLLKALSISGIGLGYAALEYAMWDATIVFSKGCTEVPVSRCGGSV